MRLGAVVVGGAGLQLGEDSASPATGGSGASGGAGATGGSGGAAGGGNTGGGNTGGGNTGGAAGSGICNGDRPARTTRECRPARS
ncbi:MAG: hypothetical protein IPI67_23525 [Myxococcales bacterium]|nr:hypothetical protein [Myxococcales bacterium]